MACRCTYKRQSERLAAAWREHLAAFGRREATLIAYGYEAARHANWLSDRGLCVCEARPADIETYVGHLRAVRGLGNRSVAARLTALRSLYRWLGRNGEIEEDPTSDIPNPKFRKPLPEVLSADQLAVLLDLPLRDGDSDVCLRNALLLRVLAWTGLRVSEAVGLDWDDLDLTPGAGTVRVRDGKGGKDRVVPMPDTLATFALRYLQRRLPLGSCRAVFPGVQAPRMGRQAAQHVVAGYGRRIGVKLSPHRLRAQCGVDMVRVGAPLPEIRAVLGHAGYDTLMPYTAVAGIEARASLEAVAARIHSADRRRTERERP